MSSWKRNLTDCSRLSATKMARSSFPFSRQMGASAKALALFEGGCDTHMSRLMEVSEQSQSKGYVCWKGASSIASAVFPKFQECGSSYS